MARLSGMDLSSIHKEETPVMAEQAVLDLLRLSSTTAGHQFFPELR